MPGEQALIDALNAEAANPAQPAATERDAARTLTAKMTPRTADPGRSARRAEREAQAAADKAAPRVSRAERLAAQAAGVDPDPAPDDARRTQRIDAARPRDADALRGARVDDDGDDTRDMDDYDRRDAGDDLLDNPLDDAGDDLPDDPLLRQADDADPENPYGLPEEVEYTDAAGKAYKVPRELVEGALRQADYTRGKQEIAELRRVTIAERAKAQVEARIATELAPIMGQVQNLHREIERLSANVPDVETDPMGYLRVDKQIRDRQAVIASLQSSIAEKRTDLLTQQQSAESELLHAGVEWLRRTTRGNWTPAIQQEVGKYAVSQGFTPEELTKQFDPRFVLMAYKAMQYEKVTQARSRQPIPADKRRTARPAPVVKPGTAAPVTTSRRPAADPRVDQLRDRVRRSGRVEDAGAAIAALLDRSRGGRR